MIKRTEYLEELIRWKDKDLIKVITGIRRQLAVVTGHFSGGQ